MIMTLICKLRLFHKKTYTGLLLNYFSFVLNCYKLALIKTLVDQFDKDLKNLKEFSS